MSKTVSKFALAAGLALAMAFTVSCFPDGGDEGGGGSSPGGGDSFGYCLVGWQCLGGPFTSKECGDLGGLPSNTCGGGYTGSYGSVTHGGQTYKTVVIGTQTWMAENLNYNASGSMCNNNNPTNCTKYGRLYDWNTALTVCPSGWHLPTQAEWNTLLSYFQSDSGCSSCDARLLKATSGWKSCGPSAFGYYKCDDAYGFSALPGGYGNSDGSFSGIGDYGHWWSASEINSDYAYIRRMSYDDEYAYWYDGSKSGLFSVRCVQGFGISPSSSSSAPSSSSALPSSSSVEVSSSSSEKAPVWLTSNQKIYTVKDGVVDGVSTEYDYQYTSYTDDKHYEMQYSYSTPYNTYITNETYTYSQVGYAQASVRQTANGNIMQYVSHNITDYTTTIVYVDPAIEDRITRTTSDITTTTTYTYDEEIWMPRSAVSTQTGTNNGESVNSSSEINYTIVPLGTEGDVKTYRVYSAINGETTGAYSEYRVQNGITMETKTYTAEGALSYTVTYTFPDNATIRAKVPTLTLYSQTTESGSGYQTCEVVRDSATELTILIKTFSAGALAGQTETTYAKRN